MRQIPNQFADSIRVSQTHLGTIKKLHDGLVAHLDKDGNVIRTSIKSLQLQGSDSTTLQIRSDGKRVNVSGNFGRFNRPDNVYNYDLDDTKIIVNNVLQELGLPKFTDGEIWPSEYRAKNGEIIATKSTNGATLSEVHYTQNFFTGSHQNAKDYIYASGRININRQKVKAYATGATFGEGSRFKASKIYDKGLDLQRLIKNGKLADSIYIQQLTSYCIDNGVIRCETQFRDYLQREGLHFWSRATHENIQPHFQAEVNTMTKKTEIFDYEILPAHLQRTYLLYEKGSNLRNGKIISNATFYRHRSELLKFGIDIKENTNVTPLVIKQKVITLSEAIPPENYILPSVTDETNSDGHNWQQNELLEG